MVIADQVTKHWALSALADGRTIDLVWTLRFNLVFNQGMAFGQGRGLGPVIGVVAIVVVVALLVSFRRGGSSLGGVGVGLVVGGALGNVVDRLFRNDAWFRGAVVDFIDLQWFPVFNIADMAINIGAGLLILGAVIGARREAAAEPDLEAEPVVEIEPTGESEPADGADRSSIERGASDDGAAS